MTDKAEMRAELIREAMADPGNVLLGIPLPELKRIIDEHRAEGRGAFAQQVRATALHDAAKAMCGYCRGLPGHDPTPVMSHDHHWHRHGKGWNACSAGPVWSLMREETK